jgi:ABC-type polysaccharide/polyol phosphate transport system ATPase subunit
VSSLSASDPQTSQTDTAPAVTGPAGAAQEPAPDAGQKPLAVRVKDLTVTYRTSFERTPTFKQAIVRFGRGERSVHQVQALKDVSFDVPEGTSLGIIGANGAGKSTLVRTLAGVLSPTAGRVEVHGKISLLALGVGFNANLSGRENIMLGGLAQGLSRRDVADRTQTIIDFAELGEFIDLPMRVYSSGMYQRLAFSVSVFMQPDILLIDEALSAGDASFKVKSAAKMQELMSSARAMFLVSHSMASIQQMCTDAIWMHKGKLMMHDTPDRCIAAYTKFLKVGEEAFTFDDL